MKGIVSGAHVTSNNIIISAPHTGPATELSLPAGPARQAPSVEGSPV